MKRIFVLFLVFIMLCSSLALCSCDALTNIFFDETDEVTDKTDEGTDGLVYKLNRDGESWTVVGLQNCDKVDIIIPAKYKGKPVTIIGYESFLSQEGIRSVHIPSTIKSIQSYAFYNCISLKKVYVDMSEEDASKISQGEHTFHNYYVESFIFNDAVKDFFK